MKTNKLAEVGHKTLDNLDEIKDSIEKQATILTCQTEFSAIEQTLQYHHEVERAKLAALYQQQAMKVDSKIKCHGSDSKRTVGQSVGSLGPALPSNFMPSYSIDDQFIQQQRSLDVLGSKKNKDVN